MAFARLLLLSFATLVSAGPFSQTLVLHEKVNAPPTGFTPDGPAPDSTTLNLRINLASNDMSGLEKALYDVSTPDSPKYGQHLSKEDVRHWSIVWRSY
jgi:tripeptidyl-peptidase I